MPEIKKSTRKRNMKRIVKDVAEANGNVSAVARKYGTSHQNLNRKINDPKNQCVIQELLNDADFKKSLIQIGLRGLEATKSIPSKVTVEEVDDEGNILKKEKIEIVEVPDHNAIHKYWRDFLKSMGYLVGDGVNIQFGNNYNKMQVTNKIMIVRAAGREKAETVDVEKNDEKRCGTD